MTIPQATITYSVTQAPLMPDECLQSVGVDLEGEGGVTWCALYMATLGLTQLSTTSDAAAAAATEGVAISLLPFAFIWFVVDVQAR